MIPGQIDRMQNFSCVGGIVLKMLHPNFISLKMAFLEDVYSMAICILILKLKMPIEIILRISKTKLNLTQLVILVFTQIKIRNNKKLGVLLT